MDGLDTATWQALGLVLTVIGLGASALVWSRRGPATGLRWASLSLLPLAAGLTGTLRLVGDVAGAVGRWSSRLVLDPLTWTGIALAGVAGVLFVVSGWMLRRSRPAGPGRPRGAVEDGARTPRAAAPGAPQRSEPAGDPELDEIEAILRRRGIT